MLLVSLNQINLLNGADNNTWLSKLRSCSSKLLSGGDLLSMGVVGAERPLGGGRLPERRLEGPPNRPKPEPPLQKIFVRLYFRLQLAMDDNKCLLPIDQGKECTVHQP